MGLSGLRIKIEGYQAWLQERGLRPATIKAYLYDVNRLCRYLGEVGLTTWPDVTVEKLLEFLAMFHTENRMGQCGYLRKTATLRTLFRYLTMEGVVLHNPMQRIDTPSDIHITGPKPRGLTKEDIQLFLESVRTGRFLSKKQKKYYTPEVQARDTAIVLLFLLSGLRVRELCNLTIGSVNFESEYLTVERKGGRTEQVPMHRMTARAVQGYLPFRQRGEVERNAPLFLGMSPRRDQLGIDAIENLVRKYALAADEKRLGRLNPMILRHTFGRMVYAQTGNAELASRALQHKQIDTLRWYVGFDPPSAKNVQDAVNKLLIR